MIVMLCVLTCRCACATSRESVDLSYKLFLCSLIAFIAPRTSVQCVPRMRCRMGATLAPNMP
jgi:hypothetical protein